ncbi:uncharacterized protein LOC131685429 [Topomyia yanbarensis]|uniref:uncharacterized protein LOC131685429 n=1 Tax=Topomyia yanbarensis TaxID=2498891 RepID=UPI00273A7C3D|nr:uncharacterized protein LOC131685429 [Topomyia yanbarensis]
MALFKVTKTVEEAIHSGGGPYVEPPGPYFLSAALLVTYPGQIPTCQFCTKKLHLGKPCVETVKENLTNPTEISPEPSYAKPLTAAKPTSSDQAPTTSNNNNETNAEKYEHAMTTDKSKTQTGTSDREQQESSTDEDMDMNDNAKEDKRIEPQMAVDNTGKKKDLNTQQKAASKRDKKLNIVVFFYLL